MKRFQTESNSHLGAMAIVSYQLSIVKGFEENVKNRYTNCELSEKVEKV